MGLVLPDGTSPSIIAEAMADSLRDADLSDFLDLSLETAPSTCGGTEPSATAD